MKIVCAPKDHDFTSGVSGDLNVMLYDLTDETDQGSIGSTARNTIRRRKLEPAERAWDLLSIALSIIAADTGIHRDKSPDGWTRQLDLHVAVGDPVFWNAQSTPLSNMLRFLTTDIWGLTFLGGGVQPAAPKLPARPEQDCVALLSGGLDSLVGTIDLVAQGKNPYAVSQVSQGDKETQSFFASQIGDGLAHLQLNHNAKHPGTNERSQRARSTIFLAYGVLVATALKRYHDGERVTLYICENGFISINPPLTDSRISSLSTRTTHPVYITLFQKLLDEAGLRVTLENPYQFSTKGEMLKECPDQDFLTKHAHKSTSCGRYVRNRYKHCGRCLPCLIRRAAFDMWGLKDGTTYLFANLSKDDTDHAHYDDVRSAAMAVAAAKADGIAKWAGPSLSTAQLGDVTLYRDIISRGLDELGAFLQAAGVK